MLSAKYFNRFKSSPPFHACASKETGKLAQELSSALHELKSGHHADDEEESNEGQESSDAVRATSGANIDDKNTGDKISTAAESQAAAETPISIQPPKRKRRLSFTKNEVEIPSKKHKEEDQLKRSCDDCLVSGK